MSYTRALFFLIVLLISVRSYSQGCSDGGVCSIGSLSILQFRFVELPSDKFKLKKLDLEDGYVTFNKDGKKDSTVLVKTLSTDTGGKVTGTSSSNQNNILANYYPRYQFNLGVHYGIGERGTTIVTAQLETTVRLYKHKLFSQIKLPYTFVNGTLGKLSAPGDVTLSCSYFALDEKKQNLVITVGTKIPTNDGNLSLNNLPLPMPYQTSLGSVDLLLGMKYGFKSWEMTMGYQHSFNANSNQYLHLSLINDSVAYNNFFESNKMQRADDAIFRVSKSFKLKKAQLGTGVLLIYHLQEDTYVNKAGFRINAPESDGLTLNLNLSGVFQLSKKTDLTFIAAGPLLNRKYRTDGLTRSLVLQAGVRWNVF